MFVSYSRRDKELVTERLLRALVAAGKEGWGAALEDIPLRPTGATRSSRASRAERSRYLH